MPGILYVLWSTDITIKNIWKNVADTFDNYESHSSKLFGALPKRQSLRAWNLLESMRQRRNQEREMRDIARQFAEKLLGVSHNWLSHIQLQMALVQSCRFLDENPFVAVEHLT